MSYFARISFLSFLHVKLKIQYNTVAVTINRIFIMILIFFITERQLPLSSFHISNIFTTLRLSEICNYYNCEVPNMIYFVFPDKAGKFFRET